VIVIIILKKSIKPAKALQKLSKNSPITTKKPKKLTKRILINLPKTPQKPTKKTTKKSFYALNYIETEDI
jgi:hypothetical protein